MDYSTINLKTATQEELSLLKENIIEENGLTTISSTQTHRKGSSFYVNVISKHEESGRTFRLEYVYDSEYGEGDDFNIEEGTVEEKQVITTEYTFTPAE